MENSHTLATESFSYSWLTHTKPPSSPSHHQLLNVFDFDFPVAASPPPPLIDADEIFSDGQIMPIYIDRYSSKVLKEKTLETSNDHYSSPRTMIFNQDYYVLPRKWRKILSYKRILKKWIGLFVKKPLIKGCSSRKISSRVDDVERINKVFESPRISSSSSTFSTVELSSSFHDIKKMVSCTDAENSIHEAILYCKRSIGK